VIGITGNALSTDITPSENPSFLGHLNFDIPSDSFSPSVAAKASIPEDRFRALTSSGNELNQTRLGLNGAVSDRTIGIAPDM